MSGYDSDNYYKNDDDYDSNAEFRSPSSSSSRKSSLSQRLAVNYGLQKPRKSSQQSSKGVTKNKGGYNNSDNESSSSSSSDVEILPFDEGIKNLFLKKKEIVNDNDKFIPGLITQRAGFNSPRLVSLSARDKKVVKDAIVKYVKKTYKNKFVLDNISDILSGAVKTDDDDTLADIESILQIYLDVSKQISIDRTVQKLQSLRKK